MRLCRSVAAACGLLLSLGPALASSFDGQFAGASSVAGGTGECWGNNPATAIVSGDTVTIRYVAYDGSQAPVVANVKPDGTFAAAQAIKGGTISYSGKIRANRLTAQWKGPVCYGTLDMTR